MDLSQMQLNSLVLYKMYFFLFRGEVSREQTVQYSVKFFILLASGRQFLE